ncbi:MAG TPA: 3-oxoacyl-[acyl-carrier-protein] reductase [Bacillota bacterium]
MRLSERVALVTGASRGIGRAIALALAAEGAAVAVNYARSQAAAQEVVDLIRQQGGRAEAFQADVADAEQVDALVAGVEAALGQVDVLVNNAGIARDGLLMRMTPEAWNEVLSTNLTAAYRTTRAVLRGMIRRRFGRIINVTSVAGITGNAGQANYAAAKAGLIGFTKSLAREVGSRGITVNAVAPGVIDTDMTAALDEEWKRRMLDQIALGRFGTPDDVAGAVVFLASDAAGYITGQTLVIDGGLTMTA